MPTYEYRCKDCGHELEAQQAFTDDPLTECPSCGGALKKKFGSVGISFKGSGFYKNDSRGSSTTPATTSHHVGLGVHDRLLDPLLGIEQLGHLLRLGHLEPIEQLERGFLVEQHLVLGSGSPAAPASA